MTGRLHFAAALQLGALGIVHRAGQLCNNAAPICDRAAQVCDYVGQVCSRAVETRQETICACTSLRQLICYCTCINSNRITCAALRDGVACRQGSFGIHLIIDL